MPLDAVAHRHLVRISGQNHDLAPVEQTPAEWLSDESRSSTDDDFHTGTSPFMTTSKPRALNC
jgi:hypothetical protein